MKAVLALIVIYVGTFLIAIQGASNNPVEASGQATQKPALDPVKEKDIRSLLELVGARDTIQDAARTATEQYREKVLQSSANNDGAQAFTAAYQMEFDKKFDADTVSNQLVGIYDQHFSDEEIRGLLEFYGSPLGQKVAAEMPQISREVQQVVRQASSQAARQAWQDLRADSSNSDKPRPFTARRRGFAAASQPNAPVSQPASNLPVQADSSQP